MDYLIIAIVILGSMRILGKVLSRHMRGTGGQRVSVYVDGYDEMGEGGW